MSLMEQSFSAGWAVAFGVSALALEAARQISDSQLIPAMGKYAGSVAGGFVAGYVASVIAK